MMRKRVNKFNFFSNNVKLLFLIICAISLSSKAFSQNTDTQIRMISSDSSGVIIELNTTKPDINIKEYGGQNYHVISYKDSSYTSEIGKPQLPIFTTAIGIPETSEISIDIIDARSSDINGYILFPVIKKVPYRSPDGIESLKDEFFIDKDFYKSNIFYPSEIAKILSTGYIRNQRISVIEIRPVQYNPALKILRTYSRILLRVSFTPNRTAPSQSFRSYEYEDKEFESLYKGLLLNYESAKSWRKAWETFKLAPAIKGPESSGESVKLFISKPGIYKLDYYTLQGAGVNLSEIDPRTFKIHFQGTQVPIYVHGEVDGRFDRQDYIEFYGAKPKSIYTRWNVYWLSWGDTKGLRMAQKSGIPTSSSAIEVTFFKSRIRFEEDHLHHKLQNVRSDPNNPDAWFESRDHWFWTGIENGSAKNEANVTFPIFDIAQTMSKPDFKVELVGCTNFEHNVMISVNGFKVGEEAKWESQDIYFYDGQIPANAINEYENQLRILRIGSHPNDGNDLDSYPYQVYLNWFEVGYFRKLLAVNDVLEFSTPEPKEDELLFTVDLSFRDSLNSGRILPTIRSRFTTRGIGLSENAIVSVQETDNKWLIIDNRLTYLVIKSGNNLNFYNSRVNNYTVSGFLNNDIEIFQISGSNAIVKFKDAIIKAYKLSQEDKDRIKRIRNITDKDISLAKTPDVAYSITFEDDGNQPFDYIAVTSSSILKPDRVEMNQPSNLKDPSNQADYIIITHPIFIESAKRLSDWRSSKNGGGFRTKVIDVTDIYDEFGNGMASTHAIKGFLKYAYNNWSKPAPSYVLILGDATYDMLGINEKFYKEAPELIGFIPTFYILSTFGQTAAEHWYSTISGDDGFPDIYLGRIPVESSSQAEDVIDKIIANESGKFNGPWRKQIISIADDDTHAAGDEIFQIGLEEVWEEHTPIGYDTTKIYLKEIIKEVESNPQFTRTPANIAKEMIINSFGDGAVIAQYSGHGGRHVWAHEIMFSITDIESMKETNIYPFLLVFSCYNGYFDIPGELCMAEGMLRARRSGVVAMFSATRLTYGTGNVALNNLLFDAIFKQKFHRIGQAIVTAKTNLLIKDPHQLTQLQEYTLFGDPASWLNLPEYEIQPQVANLTVSSSVKLEVQSGQVLDNITGKASYYNGNVTAEMHLPDSSNITQNISVVNGNYPSLSFDIPAGAASGRGELKFFGQDETSAVVGGIRFSVKEPLLVNINYEVNGNELQIYANISDDAKELKSATLIWSADRSSTENRVNLVFDAQKRVYKLPQALAFPTQVSGINYQIVAQDMDGNVISSKKEFIKLIPKVNFRIDEKSTSFEPDISYIFSTEYNSYGLDIRILNKGDINVKGPLKVLAFEGNPDKNNDKVVDDDAIMIGEKEITDDKWTLENSIGNQSVKVFIERPLSIGRHLISVWIDPEFNINHPVDKFGAHDENNENDNLSYIILDSTQFLLNPGQDNIVKSIDEVFYMNIPSGSVNQNLPIKLNRVSEVSTSINQPDIFFISFPWSSRGGYAVSAHSSPAIEQLERPVSTQIKFDLDSFIDEIKKDIGYGGITYEQMTQEQRDILERELKNRVSNIGAYIWNEPTKKWERLPSKPALSDTGTVLRRVYAVLDDKSNEEKIYSGIINNISLDPSAKTPLDSWSIIFIDSQRFNVRGAKAGTIMQNNEPYTGVIGKEFYDEKTGIRFIIKPGIKTFSAGDELRFRTIETGIIQAESDRIGIMTLMFNKDNRPPIIQLDVSNQNFTDGDYVSATPEIHGVISDRNGVNVSPNKLSISISKDSEDFIPVKENEYTISYSGSSNDVVVNYSPGKLEPGKYEVRFQAYDYNGNLGVRTIKFEVKKEFDLVKGTLMNYPNPFERETDITFVLTSMADSAVVKIYTVSGRLIRTLEQIQAVNFVTIHWDGRDEDGKEVANGVYYYRVTLKREGKKNIIETGKMMKLK